MCGYLDLRGKPKGTVKVKVTVKRKGKTVRETGTAHDLTRGARSNRYGSWTMRPSPPAG